ncbi:MAG TPA: rhamnulokinase family protein [Bryobacteraceae bacterium]|nr:rhamnulokinase family protein [Bryobacteraceae bacterium]
MKNFLAFDFGAESGRAILGSLRDDRLVLEELHRFPNQPVRLPGGLYWDTFRLFHEIQQGLAIAGRERKLALDGIGIDTWGVDFGLLGSDGALVDNPRHYRDARNNGMLERTFEAVPRDRIFAETGIQFMQLNSLYQLYAAKLEGAPGLEIAEKLLFTPDLFNYWLTGVAKSELSIASTSQFYNPTKKRWATELFEQLGLPVRILAEIVQPGSLLGPLLPHVREAAGMGPVPVYATCCHDTASAVAAVPAQEGGNWCYISSGTWSLMGVERREPLINSCVLDANFTNELGAAGTVRFLKNIAGLWLWQECRRAWQLEGRDCSYSEMSAMASAARPFSAIIDPDAFPEPVGMPGKIARWCRSTGQEAPGQPEEMCRAILEGLALRYRQVLEGLESLTGTSLGVIHIVGGGSKNRVLNQFVADATNRTVIAGPAEATAAGNILVQAIGAGALSGLEDARALVRKSFELETYLPGQRSGWDAAYARFVELKH